jgi:hypothetical protein
MPVRFQNAKKPIQQESAGTSQLPFDKDIQDNQDKI